MSTQKKIQGVIAVLVFMGIVFLTGCSGGAYKSSGQYKRDILLERVGKTSKCHEEAKKQFEGVLANYSKLVDASDTDQDLRVEYNNLAKSIKKASSVVKDLARKIKNIEKIGKPMFRDWEDELDEYGNETIRRSSEVNLDATRSEYLKVVHTIKDTKVKVEKVLKALNDQMLFLNQNLSLRTLESFKKEVTSLKEEVGELITQLDLAIDETQKFSEIRDIVAIKVIDELEEEI